MNMEKNNLSVYCMFCDVFILEYFEQDEKTNGRPWTGRHRERKRLMIRWASWHMAASSVDEEWFTVWQNVTNQCENVWNSLVKSIEILSKHSRVNFGWTEKTTKSYSISPTKKT